MGETPLTTSLEMRAIHEAGHVIMAYAYRQHYPEMLWATLLPQGRSGGSCGFGETKAPPEVHVAVATAGIWAETLFRAYRARDDRLASGCPCDEELDRDLLEEGLRASIGSGYHDIECLWEGLDGLAIDDADKNTYFEQGKQRAFGTLQACWAFAKRLARELEEAVHHTMYYDEAFRTLGAMRDGRPVVIGQLMTYRATRRPKEPPAAWGLRGPWFERFDEWYERDPILRGESYSQWRQRRLRDK